MITQPRSDVKRVATTGTGLYLLFVEVDRQVVGLCIISAREPAFADSALVAEVLQVLGPIVGSQLGRVGVGDTTSRANIGPESKQVFSTPALNLDTSSNWPSDTFGLNISFLPCKVPSSL